MTTSLARGIYRRIASPLYLALSLAILLPGQTTLLETGKTVEGRLSDGEWRDYSFTLKAGDYASVLIDQRSINIAVRLFAPEGKEVFSADSETTGETESAELIAEVPGTYRLRIAPSEPHPPSGEYAVTLKIVEPATERHRMRVAAATQFARGMSAYLEGSRDGMLKAIDHLANALSRWRAAQDRVAESRASATIAILHAEAGNPDKAFEFANQALPVAEDSRDPLAQARALDALGQVNYYFGDKRKAIQYYERALPLMRAAGNRAAEASTLSNLGVAYRRTGDKRKALEHLNEAMAISRRLQDRRMMAEIAGNMGVAYDDLGEYQKALENHQNDLALKRELGDRANEAIAWNNIGTAYSGFAEYQKALDAYNTALDINRSMGNQWNVAVNLNNIAWVYGRLADQQRALTFYQESLGIVRKINDRRMVAVTLNNIAEIHAELGDYRRAADLHLEALPLRRAAVDADGEANSLNNLGKVYDKLGDRAKAREYLEQALAKHRTNGNRHMMSGTLRNLGELDCETGDYEQARQFLNEALATSRAIHDPNGEAVALADLARLERDLGNLGEAHQRADEAMTALESVRLAVASPKLRASFFATARDLQELNIEVLMRINAQHPGNGYDAGALLASERGRARSLLEMLGEGAAGIRRGVDEALLARERELERLISAKADLQLRLLGGKHTDTEAKTIANELDKLTADLDQVQSRIRQTSPQYAALTHPVPLKLQEIQTKVLDRDTVLLEYALGKARSFLWAVTDSSVQVFELPPRAEIESSAKRVYELLTERNRKPARETPAARTARVRQAERDFPSAAANASRLVLGPAASVIKDKRLLVVAEGVLQYLPFAALPDPDAQTVPIAVKHEVIMIPSASVLSVLRDETANRKPAEKALAVIADPVFSADDPRLTHEKQVASNSAAGSPGESGQEFMRLRFSRAEAEEIAQLAPPEATLKALDFDASRETVMSPEIGQYRIVHFATHSLLDNQRPELSGVVLSLFDRSGQPRNGFLRLYDIYNLRLSSELVVLSACQTALGGEVKGEGLIGLTRGFLYAGAARVVATLWEIDDRTTSELMKRFYESMLVRGERPAAALRAAQVAMWRAKGWDQPYYWGGFTIHGEWR